MTKRTAFNLREELTHDRHGSIYVIDVRLHVVKGRVEIHEDDGFVGSSDGTPRVFFSDQQSAVIEDAEMERLDEFVEGLHDPDATPAA